MIKPFYLKALASLFAVSLASQACTVVTKNDDETDESDTDEEETEEESTDGSDTEEEESDEEEATDGSDTEEETASDEEEETASDEEEEEATDGEEEEGEGDAGAEEGEEAEGDAGAEEGEEAEGDGGGAEEGEGGEGGEVKFGSIGLTQTVLNIEGLPDPIVSASAFGSFSITTSSGGDAQNDCETTTVDSCTLTVCPIAEAGGGGGGEPPVSVGAGDITFTGLAADLSMSFDDTTGFYSAASMELLWEESAEVTVEAAGSDDVPAFSMSVALPDPISITAPVADAASNFALSRSESLEVAWDGGGEGMVTVAISGSTDAESMSISCFAPSADGSVTVDSSLLEGLPDSGAFSASASASASAVSDIGDDWMVSFSGVNSGAAGTTTVSD